MEELIKECNLGTTIKSINRVTGGLSHRMYKIVTDKGVYAIKELNSGIMKKRTAYSNFLFAEKVTGKTDNREQYQAMKVLIQRLVDINAKKPMEQRDTIEVVIEELDRLGRTKKNHKR